MSVLSPKLVPAAKVKTRLDVHLVDQGVVESRTKAAAAILAGEVYVGGVLAKRPGQLVTQDAVVEMRPRRGRYVSRGGEKLEHALQVFGIDPKDRVVLDVGASTGGFTDCLLQHGARRVYAVDVGTGQLAWTLRRDPRVVALEQQDIRQLSPHDLGELCELATVDVAFISLTRVLPAVLPLMYPEGAIIVLVKPQFEVGPKAARRGVVRDAPVHRRVVQLILDRASEIGLAPAALTYSPLAGPDGNLEFFVHLRLRGSAIALDVDAVVAEAHRRVPRRGSLRRVQGTGAG